MAGSAALVLTIMQHMEPSARADYLYGILAGCVTILHRSNVGSLLMTRPSTALATTTLHQASLEWLGQTASSFLSSETQGTTVWVDESRKTADVFLKLAAHLFPGVPLSTPPNLPTDANRAPSLLVFDLIAQLATADPGLMATMSRPLEVFQAALLAALKDGNILPNVFGVTSQCAAITAANSILVANLGSTIPLPGPPPLPTTLLSIVRMYPLHGGHRRGQHGR